MIEIITTINPFTKKLHYHLEKDKKQIGYTTSNLKNVIKLNKNFI